MTPVWVVMFVLQYYPYLSKPQAEKIASEAVTVCEATVGELEPRPFLHCILDTIPGVMDSATRNE